MGETIVCFGDSLTEGFGAGQGEDFPSLLAQKVSLPVINAGVSGDTTADALKRINEDVLAHDPRIVIVFLGGNDFLRKIPKEETFNHLDKITEIILRNNAMVVIVSVRVGFFTDEHAKRFKNLAKERNVLLIPNILKGIINHPDLKSDHIHPNSEGYKIIAERIYKGIEPLLNN